MQRISIRSKIRQNKKAPTSSFEKRVEDLLQIVKKISDYLSPTVIGIRMPVLFNNEEFYIDTNPFIYFIGIIVLLEHIFIIYLTQN